MSQAPQIFSTKVPEHVSAQSKYEFAAALPTRSLILAPSGGGKTVLLQNMILDIYRDCFSRIYIFSPSIDVDMTWNPVKEYLKHEMKQDERKERYLFDAYEPGELLNIINTQHKIAEFMKDNKMKKVFQILIIIDDFEFKKMNKEDEKKLTTLFRFVSTHKNCSLMASYQSFFDCPS